MDYKLAKKLKDAGFPQNRCLCGQVPCPTCRGEDITKAVYRPTLEELIEACGARFFAVHVNLTKTGYVAKTTIIGEVIGEGTTPVEAVGRLYIAINKSNAA